MKFGVMFFSTEYSMRPEALGPAVEERGVESLSCPSTLATGPPHSGVGRPWWFLFSSGGKGAFEPPRPFPIHSPESGLGSFQSNGISGGRTGD